eukprot:791097-Rhodomonas_salina.1
MVIAWVWAPPTCWDRRGLYPVSSSFQSSQSTSRTRTDRPRDRQNQTRIPLLSPHPLQSFSAS